MTLLVWSRWVNGVLFVLALASVVLVLGTGGSALPANQLVRARHLLVEYEVGAVTELLLTRNGQRVQLRRNQERNTPDAARWSLTEPVETDAEVSAVDQLLGTLRYATWLRPATGKSVEPTSPTLRITQPGGSVSLTLGGPAASPSGAHFLAIQVEGEPNAKTYVINERVVRDVFVPLGVFRGRQLVPYRKSSIERVILSSAAGTRRLVEEGGVFRFDKMRDGQRAERKGLDRIFLALARSVADPFIDLEVARAALSVQSTVHVSLLARDPEKPEASLQFGGECPGQPGKALVIRHTPEPLAGCVDKGIVTVLREPADTLIDRGLFTLSRDEVDTLRIVAGEHSLELLRDGQGFALRTTLPDGNGESRSRVDTQIAEDRLRRILGLRGDLLTRRSKPRGGKDFNALVLTVESSSVPGRERVVETVRISKPRKKTGAVWAYRDSDAAVLLLSSGSALALRADSTLLKPLAIFDYPSNQVQEISVTRSKKTQRLRRRESGGFTLVLPKRYALDASLATEMVDRLRHFDAIRWITDRKSESFGLRKPRAQVTLKLQVADQEVVRTLRIGRAAPGGYYASVDRNPGVFVLPSSVWRTLTTLLIDRSVFRVERDSIFEISIAAGRKRLLVRRVAGELTVIKSTLSFDAESLDSLVEALGNLNAEAAVHLGRRERGEGLKRPRLEVAIRRRSPSTVGTSRVKFRIGSRDTFQGASIYYARRSNVNATYALPRRQVQSLLDLF